MITSLESHFAGKSVDRSRKVHTLSRWSWPDPSTRFKSDPNRSHQGADVMCVEGWWTDLIHCICSCMSGFSMRSARFHSCALQWLQCVLFSECSNVFGFCQQWFVFHNIVYFFLLWKTSSLLLFPVYVSICTRRLWLNGWFPLSNVWLIIIVTEGQVALVMWPLQEHELWSSLQKGKTALTNLP